MRVNCRKSLEIREYLIIKTFTNKKADRRYILTIKNNKHKHKCVLNFKVIEIILMFQTLIFLQNSIYDCFIGH